MAGLLVTAANQHVNADLAFLDLAEEQLLTDETALAELATPPVATVEDALNVRKVR